MQINKVSNQNFGLKMSYGLQGEFAKIHGPIKTSNYIKQIANIGSNNTYYTDFNQLSLKHEYGVSVSISKEPIALSEKELRNYEEQLLEKAMMKAAKEGNLLAVTNNLKRDYKSLENIIKSIFMTPKLHEIDSKVETYKMHHPLLYKLGFRPNTKNI